MAHVLSAVNVLPPDLSNEGLSQKGPLIILYSAFGEGRIITRDALKW
jgi:hypothetical protein